MATTPLDWSKFQFNGKVLSGYDNQSLGGTYGSFWDNGLAKPGATTPWGTTIGGDVFNPGSLGAGNTQAYDQFLNLKGGQNLGENQRYQDGALQTYNGDTGWSIDPSSNTDGSIYPYQNQFELNSGFHRYDINNLLQTGGGEHAAAWQNILPYLKGEDLLSYDPQWGVVAKDSKSAERIGALIDTIHGSYAGPEQRAALRSSLIAMASMGLGAALAPAAGAAGGAGAAAAEGGGSLMGTGFGELSGGAGSLSGAAGGASNIFGTTGDSIFGGFMNGSPLADIVGSGGFNLSDWLSSLNGITGSGNTVFGGLGAGLGEAGGGGMSFFDDILGNVFPGEVDTSSWGDLLGNGYEGLDYGPGWDLGDYTGIDSSTVVPGFENLTNQGGILQWFADQGVPFDILQKLGSANLPVSTLKQIGQKLFGGSGGGGGGLFGSNGNIDLGSLLGGGLGALGIGGALAYGLNQTPDLSKLNAAYAALDPTALTREYDINTDTGRNALNTSLTNRGVMGSSFGNADQANFNTTRDIGRRSLLNAGVGQQANIANMILTGQNNNARYKNQLIGSALNSFGLLGS
jgi:hypothetical protein